MVSVEIKKRKVSKKTKKSWRKHVDTKDVETFLNDQRLEERLGKPFSARKNEELFTVDTKRDDDLINETTYISKKARRELLKNKEPKCFEILKPHTAVPDPIIKRNRVKTQEERKSVFIKRKDIEKTVKRLQNKSCKKSQVEPKKDIDKDVWQVELMKVEPQLKSEWLDKTTKKHNLVNTGRKQKKLPASLHKKPSVLPAVNPPHPGTSYNPSFTDHQDLLSHIAADEMKVIKKEAHLNRVTNKMFRKVTQAEKHEDNIKEMSEGLPLQQKNEPSEDEDEDDDPNVVSINPPTNRENKKTLVQRRKQKEQEVDKHLRLKSKIEKKKVADIYHLKQLRKQISKKQQKEEVLRKKRLENKAKKELEPKELSRNKFEPLEQEFQLGEELSGNLRNAQPSGTLLKDRYKSLQERNIVAPGTVVLKKNKAKVKRFTKPDHKINLKK